MHPFNKTWILMLFIYLWNTPYNVSNFTMNNKNNFLFLFLILSNFLIPVSILAAQAILFICLHFAAIRKVKARASSKSQLEFECWKQWNCIKSSFVSSRNSGSKYIGKMKSIYQKYEKGKHFGYIIAGILVEDTSEIWKRYIHWIEKIHPEKDRHVLIYPKDPEKGPSC